MSTEPRSVGGRTRGGIGVNFTSDPTPRSTENKYQNYDCLCEVHLTDQDKNVRGSLSRIHQSVPLFFKSFNGNGGI
jgi:hypothetical protein